MERSDLEASAHDDRHPTPIVMASMPAHAPEVCDEWEDEMLLREASEADDDVIDFVDARLRASADAWPAELVRPVSVAEAVDQNGRWGSRACGVEVRLCTREPAKGLGAFATRPLAAGAVVGVYAGERLTMREHALRHGWKTGNTVATPSRADKRALAARIARLAALTSGAPMGGEANGSGYCFSLFSDDVKAALGSDCLPRRFAYIDGEDPQRSSWCRYINHAKASTLGCNLKAKVDGMRGHIWFEAIRPIAAGEELGFDYGVGYRWDR